MQINTDCTIIHSIYKQTKTIYWVNVCFPNSCIQLASNLIVPPCGFGEIHCGLCVWMCASVCSYESVCCGCRGYSMWHQKTVSVPLLPSVVVTLCLCVSVCIYALRFFLVCAFASVCCVCVCACQ